MYYGNQIGVLYENLSYSNFNILRKQLITSNKNTDNFNIDDAVAIMKIRGTDGKYVLEGTDNWFSMTLFDNKISDKKQEKILDILDWLLSEEGTRFAIYGFEGYDYDIVDGEVVINEDYWPKGTDGQYGRKDNGGKYLRYLASLGYDTLSYDPLTHKPSIKYLADWENEMKVALGNGELKVLKERTEVMWLTTKLKSKLSGGMRKTALKNAMIYMWGDEITTVEQFKDTFGYPWPDVLKEINDALGK